MDFKREIREASRNLQKLQLDEDTRASLWAVVEERLTSLHDGGLSVPQTSHRRGRYFRTMTGSVLAGVAGVAVVAAGVLVTLHQGQRTPTGTAVTTVGTGTSARGAQNASAVSAPDTNSTSPSSNPLFQTSLTLPNGEVITPLQTVGWKDLNIALQVPSLPPPQAGPDRYLAVVGNHSTVLSHSTVQTSVGLADFVLNERTPSAASGSTKPTYEYWMIVYGSEYAYAIDATVTGNLQAAKAELLSLVNNWVVPGKPIPESGQPVTVADIRKYYAAKLQRVVKVIPYPTYDAVIVESNRNPTIADDFTWWDLKTSQHEFLAGRPEYLKIDHVVNADEVVFLATGGNSESPGLSFPYYVIAKRPNAGAAFTTTRQTAYFAVNKTVSFGDGKVESLTRISASNRGVSLQFGPNRGESLGTFAAGAYGIPQTTVSYGPGANEMEIRLKDTRLRLVVTSLSVQNHYVSWVSERMQGADAVLTLHLTAGAKYYTGILTHGNPPTLSLSFATLQP